MNCLFCKIIKGQIPARCVYETDEIYAFHDIAPQAPTHILIIPKRHITNLNETNFNDHALLGIMVQTAQKLAVQEGIAETGYRLIMNTNAHGGQSVDHMHLHLLGGRAMSWPPG